MWTKFRHKVVFAILRPILAIYFKIRYNLKIVKHKEKGPFLILANHSMTMDPFFIGCLLKEPIYFVANEDLFNKGFLSSLIKYLVAPIPKSKSMRDIECIRNCLKVRKEGKTICIFPEGNRTYSGRQCKIDKAIVKLVKKLDLPVLLVNISGGFQTDPRFSNFIRKGRITCAVNKIITKEELQHLDLDELYTIIEDGLDVKLIEDTPYKSKKKAMYLERVIYYCPDCKSFETMSSEGNFLTCGKCGYKLFYNEYAKFELINGNYRPLDLGQYYSHQEELIKSFDLNEMKSLVYLDNEIRLFLVTRGTKKSQLYAGMVKMENGKIIFSDKFEFDFREIDAKTVLGKNKLNFYIKQNTYQIKGNKAFCALKYMHAYYHYMNLLNVQTEDEFLGL